MSQVKVLETLKQHLLDTNSTKEYHVRPQFKFILNDVEHLVSIQASSSHYSTPRKNNHPYYEAVEIGFPNFNFSDKFISHYAEQGEEPQDTVYGYVPLEELALELHNLGYTGE